MNKIIEMAQPIQMQYAALRGSVTKTGKSQVLFSACVLAFLLLSTTLIIEKPSGPMPDRADVSMFNENQYRPSLEASFEGQIEMASDDCAFVHDYLVQSCGPGKAPCQFQDKGTSCSYAGRILSNKSGKVYLPAMCTGKNGSPYSGCMEFPVTPVVIRK